MEVKTVTLVQPSESTAGARVSRSYWEKASGEGMAVNWRRAGVRVSQQA